MREQIEKLEQANAKLRTKGRESSKLAKAAANRIAELEEQVAQLEQDAARRAPAVKEAKPKAARRPRPSRRTGPADAVAPDVAVQDPGPPEGDPATGLETPDHNLQS